MKVIYLIILVLSALFGTCICMDGFFNSSDFDAMDEEFGIWLRFFLYLPVMVHQVIFDLKIQKDNPKDDSLIEEILLQIFD